MVRVTECTVGLKTEILNALFDIYADATFDYDTPVFIQGSYLSELKRALPLYKTSVNDMKKQTIEFERADETLLNLIEFISYKESEFANR